ncbi:protein EPIDERMAL PATTERNING FACTOR 1 [Ipomoea triloba]|uniref:protein EPIDERMAL PATTERNING FACTOR 1 n=1 Tax=Ipomoea triloba TaxID=35885 RepID=UPI00125CF019|nr:protein EPIDERMAL PATTERNING FACTOR 1 [Ipomoea triloba]
MMKGCAATLLIIILLLFSPFAMPARRIGKFNPNERHGGEESSAAAQLGRKTTMMMQKRGDTLEIAGSRLPDCSHACGSCHPCRLVMVSFVCSTLEEAETCPMAYKCMCHNKSYPIP